MTDTENNEPQVEQTPEDTTVVETHEATDEQLQSFLSTHKEEELESDDTPEAPQKEEDSQDAKPATKTEDAPQQETSEVRIARLEKQKRDKELFIQRQAAELGQLRKEKEELIKAKSQGLDERFLETPQQAIRDELDIRKAKEDLEGLHQQERVLRSRALVESNVTPQEGLPEAMVECLKADGVDEEYIRAFQDNPYTTALPGEIIQLAKRAEVLQVTRAAIKRIADLEVQLADAQKKPERLLSKVESALRSSPRVTGKSGQSLSKTAGYSAKQLASMSDAELRELSSSTEE